MASITPITGNLGAQRARHLLRRATFMPTNALTQSLATKTITQALNDLFTFTSPIPATPLYNNGQPYIPTAANPLSNIPPEDGSEWVRNRVWWLSNAKSSPNLQYRLIQFLHSVWVINDVDNDYRQFFDYLELLRYHANGSLKDLAIRMTRQLSMLAYLDNYLNTATNPNENYAREFLELFTIIRGPQIAPGNYTNYTEQDVVQAARVFTGFTGDVYNPQARLNNIDPTTQIPRGIINVANHNSSNKTFSAQLGGFTITGGNATATIQQELEQFVTQVFNNTATAKSYARRLYRFFVRREINTEIETDIITPLSNTLLNNNYNLELVVRQLLSSQHFFDADDTIVGDEIIGGMVKSPLELLLHFINQFEITLPSSTLQPAASYNFYAYKIFYHGVREMNYPLFAPFNVKGYAPYTEEPYYDKLWVTTGSLRARYYNYAQELLAGYTLNGVMIRLNIVNFVRYSGHFSNPSNAVTLLQDMFNLCLCNAPTGARYTYYETALLGGLTNINWQNDWNDYLSTNNDNVVRIALERLVIAIVQSPEYQVM